MKRKSLQEFIQENREEIDRVIRSKSKATASINNEERRLWILNDEALYNWARSEKVNV